MLTLKILASLLQLHGPGATVQSDHQGIDALLNNMRDQNADAASDKVAPTQAAFARTSRAGRLLAVEPALRGPP